MSTGMPDPQENEPPQQKSTNGTNGSSRFEPGAPIPWFARQPINTNDTLLDLRYLCRGGGLLVVAPSGQGKSTLAIQSGILWSCGRTAFEIVTTRPLNILIIQAEDDQGDCTEMSAMINHLGLTEVEYKLVEENTEIIRCNNLAGEYFASALRNKLKERKKAGRPVDLIILNPYSTYLGDDVLSARNNIAFLNELLNPLLTYFCVGMVIIHHTPKTSYTDFNKLNPWDWQYSGAGSAALTNWARAILVIVPQEHSDRVFMFVAAKRGKRLELWEDSIIRYFKHSPPGEPLQWLDVTDEEKNEAVNTKKKKPGKIYPSIDEIIEKCVSLTDWLSERRIYDVGQKVFGAGNCGEKKVHDALVQGVIEDNLSRREVKNPKGKALPEYIRNK